MLDLGKINKSGKQLLALINDILDISKIESGKMDLYFKTCDLTGLIRDVMNMVKPLIEENGNQLGVHLIDGDITTDTLKLRQILLNLLSDVAKFTNAGRIVFEVTRQTMDNKEGYCFSVNGEAAAEKRVYRYASPKRSNSIGLYGH